MKNHLAFAMYRSKYAVFRKKIFFKIAQNPVFMRVFSFFVLLKSSLVPYKKYDSSKVLIWDELLFLFFVSITPFVEIMSRISNCFLISN